MKTAAVLAAAWGGGAALSACELSRAVEARPEGRAPAPGTAGPAFTISLAEWSVHRAVRSGTLEHLDFPMAAKLDYGIDAVEYVSTLFKAKGDERYVAELAKRCDELAVKSLLIMCDGEGALGDPDEGKRAQAVDNHRKWLDAAKQLGCHAIRVNAQSAGSREEQMRLASDGLRRLCERAEPYGLSVLVENHGGLSSHGDWLAGVMRLTAHPRVGTLPDFGNFDPKEYDKYTGVEELMPFARAVSAKSHEFDPVTGEEVRTDYRRMLGIVMGAGYRGWIGIEYEGDKHTEAEGIRATKRLLEKVRAEMAARPA